MSISKEKLEELSDKYKNQLLSAEAKMLEATLRKLPAKEQMAAKRNLEKAVERAEMAALVIEILRDAFLEDDKN